MNPAAAITTDAISPRRSPGRIGWLLMAPLLLWLAVFVIAPTVILLSYSFYQPGGIGQAQFRWRDDEGNLVIFNNYKRIFDAAYLPVFYRAMGEAVLGGAIATGIVLLYRYLVNQHRAWDGATARLLVTAAIPFALLLVELLIALFGAKVEPYPQWQTIWFALRPGFWAGILVAISHIFFARDRWRSALVLGLIAGFVFGFDAYIELVKTGNFLQILWRSVKYAAYTTIWCIVLGYPVAYFIGRASEANRNRLLMLLMVPFWTSFLIRTFAWITILKSEGTLNGLLSHTGMTSLLAHLGQFQFVSDFFSYRGTPYISAEGKLELLYTPAAIMIGLVYSYLPFMILPIYGSVEKLDNALVEAAFDLGAGPVRAFQHVIIPLTQPGIIAGCLLVFIPAIGMFAVQDLLGGRSVQMIGNIIQNQFGQARNAPFGAALGMTIVFLFALVFWLSSRKHADQ